MPCRTLCGAILAAMALPIVVEAAETNACIALVERKGVVTASLQSAIDATSASGGGIVRLPRGRFLTDGIRLKDNVTLEIPAGSVLVASTDVSAYAEQTVNYVAPDGSKSCKAFICAENATNVAITGKGTVIGCGCFFTLRCAARGRPRLLRFIDCRNVRVEGVTLLAPATWTCHFMRCDGVTVRGVKIESHANYNCDGLDIEAKNVLVEDCDIDVEDDAVCFKSDTPTFAVENCEVRNCRISSNCNFIKFGTASAGTYRKIDVHDCEVSCKTPSGFTDWRYWEWQFGMGGIPGVRTAKCGLAGIALEVVDGGVMEDVSVRNIEIGAGVQTPILIRQGRRHESAVKGRPSVMRNILIENVRAVAPAESLIACSITGVPGLRPRNIVLRNVDLLFPGDVEPPFPGGREVSEKFDSVPEVEGSYPENRMFGTILPAWGFYVRHVDGIAFENVNLKLANPDRREHAVVAVDVSEISVKGCNFTPHVQYSQVPFAMRVHGDGDRPRIELSPTGAEAWDFSGAGEVRVTVSNTTDSAQRVRVSVFREGMPPNAAPKPSVCGSRIPPQSIRVIAVQLNATPYATDEPVALTGMLGKVPVLKKLPNFGKIGRIEVCASRGLVGEDGKPTLAILGVSTAHPARVPKVIPASDFFPFCDRYGQFIHDDWPWKVHSDAELLAARDDEEAWLAAHAASPIPDADQYGGWAGGPQLEATGFFRTEKVDGKWWFVDPSGRLFWSLGVCSVYPGLPTKVSGRESYFASRSNSSDFWPVSENLSRKYGKDWRPPYAESTQRRFRAWGLNTIGNWNHHYICNLRRTPYCLCIDFSSKTVSPTWDGSKAHGRAVPDVDSPQFVADLTVQAGKWAATMKDDPWCLGVFVDNELGWDGCGGKAGEVAEKYYSTVRAVLKKSLPNHLYLGSRIHNDFGEIPAVWIAASRHCDVVSNNHYDFLPSYDLPAGADDKPIMIGEFHFGFVGAGYFSGGLVAAFDAAERARMFHDYVGACLDHPRYVGAHWFQYHDQPFTGRFDGENFQCGFVSVCDVPHPEMVEASRALAAEMYGRRSGAASQVAAAPSCDGMPRENEKKAYGELSNNIVARLELWPGLAPHETTREPGRFVFDEKQAVWRPQDVSSPYVIILKPSEVRHDTLVMAIPGGAYNTQNMGTFCRNVRPILDSGRWVAVLHHRIPRRTGRAIYDAPREDGARAIRLLRANAGRFGYSSEKIGVLGFSAGGNLAALLATSSLDKLYERIDDADALSPSVSFAVLVYPAYVTDDGMVIRPEFKFDSKTPPMFLLHGDEDEYTSMASVLLYAELHRRKIPAQLFVFAHAAHGLGANACVLGWQWRIAEWLGEMEF